MLVFSFRRARCAALLVLAAACSGGRTAADNTLPPQAEFLVDTPDSTFWVTTVAGKTRVRGVPLVLAHYDGRFFEVYAAEDDYSYDDALLVGERVYRRDLVTGDSTLVFADTIVPRVADAYARAHPDEQPLAPDEEGEARPSVSATAEVEVIDLSGPYLSYEYHVDVDLPGRDTWHTTRRGVVDLRTGQARRVADLLGPVEGARLTAQGQSNYEATRDSIVRALPSLHGDERRAAAALQHVPFDERSFTLSSEDGRLAVHFSVPGRGDGPLGNVLELTPLAADSAAWWTALSNGLPTTDDAGNDRWTGPAYAVLARYDTSGELARLSIANTAKLEWPLMIVQAPLRRIDWLEPRSFSAADRRALSHAFDQAAVYDENVRVAALGARGTTSLARRRLVRRSSALFAAAFVHSARTLQSAFP
jgi:hypothetical protein